MADPSQEDELTGSEQPFVEHLIELRDRLLYSLYGIAAAAIVLAIYPGPDGLLNFIAHPIRAHMPPNARLIAVDVFSPFFIPLKVLMIVAVLLALPWVMYQLWSFVAPGLYRHEKRLAMPLLVSAIVLFYAGCAFAYFLVLPSVFHALTVFTPDIVTLAPDPAKYLDFVMVIFLAFGVSFELPVALVIMVLLGWVTPQQLREGRGYAIVGVFVVAALITPPDVVSQLMLAIPMCLLYELGIVAAGWLKPRPRPDSA